MYDVIVVGARCAGAPTAMLLARKGYRVLMVDKDAFPSDIMSTHYIHQPGVAHLKQWGLLDQVVATNCPPITKIAADFGPLVLKGTPPPADGADAAFCPRRRLLDQILIDAAVKAGAEMRESFTVHELTKDGDSVIGISGRAGGGSALEEQAKLVIGADGVHSVVARLVNPPEYEVVPSRSCGYYSYFSGVPVDSATIYNRGKRLLYSFPTNDGLTCIAEEWPDTEFHEFRADIEGNFNRTLQLVPALAEAVSSGHREERFVGTGDMPNFFRRPHGPGWALVGDAGYHKDPVTGQGITDSFRDAGLLAEAIDDGFSGRVPLEQALAGYEQRRNQVAMPIYQLTLQQVAYEPPPPEILQLIAAVHTSQEETNRFLGLLAGTTPIPEYFAPENVQRIIGAAQATQPRP
jgi:2-polyprenyl-6-methoxyphenol hydroxylase-like FAD-dependent oxidoreductase